MKKLTQLLLVLPVCFLLAGLAVMCYLLDPAFIPDLYRISSMVVVVAWAFFIVPSLLFEAKAAIEYFKGETNEQAFRSGARIGVVFGLGGLLILCLLFSPVTGTIWFVQTIDRVVSDMKEKKRASKKEKDDSDVFDV